MIIEMQKGADEPTIQRVVERVKEFGFDVQLNVGEEEVVIAVLGSNTGIVDTQVFEALPGVERVFRIMEPFKLASRKFKPTSTIVKIENVEIGENKIVIMAGPCAVESEAQLLSCARIVQKNGGKILRGGAFKPRTSPFGFQGLEEKGLKLLAKAREETGLLIVTEAVAAEDVGLISKYADIIQVGARNMQNYRLLKAAGKSGRPVLLKNGFASKIEEWLCAADYLLNENNGHSVILCARGIRTFEDRTRFSFPVEVIPVVKRFSHLPIIGDPSHPSGDFRYVPAVARAIIAAGADGLLMEIHPDPKKALSDGAQSLTFSDFSRLMRELKDIAKAIGREI